MAAEVGSFSERTTSQRAQNTDISEKVLWDKLVGSPDKVCMLGNRFSDTPVLSQFHKLTKMGLNYAKAGKLPGRAKIVVDTLDTNGTPLKVDELVAAFATEIALYSLEGYSKKDFLNPAYQTYVSDLAERYKPLQEQIVAGLFNNEKTEGKTVFTDFFNNGTCKLSNEQRINAKSRVTIIKKGYWAKIIRKATNMIDVFKIYKKLEDEKSRKQRLSLELFELTQELSKGKYKTEEITDKEKKQSELMDNVEKSGKKKAHLERMHTKRNEILIKESYIDELSREAAVTVMWLKLSGVQGGGKRKTRRRKRTRRKRTRRKRTTRRRKHSFRKSSTRRSTKKHRSRKRSTRRKSRKRTKNRKRR